MVRAGGLPGLAFCVVAPLGATSAAEPPFAIVGARVVAPDGTLTDGRAIVIADGKVRAVIARDRVEHGVRIRRHAGAVVSPGLIDPRSTLGVYGHNIERVRPIDAAAAVRSAVDRSHADFRAAMRAGVTAALLCPAPNNVVSGAAAGVRVGGADGIELLRLDGPLLFALGASALRRDREPTSRIGALHLLRRTLETARAGQGAEPLVGLVKGRVPAIVVCERGEDVSAALRTFAAYGVLPIIAHTSEATEVSAEFAGREGARVIVGPYTFDMPPRVLAGAAVLAGAGVEVSFAGRLPAAPADSLRITAALAVRYGMKPAAARRAMTVNAARAAGLDERVGSIAAGKDADLVVFSGDPLRLDSRVLEVYVKGVRVYDASIQGDN